MIKKIKNIKKKLKAKWTPFDHISFFEENTETVLRYLSANTLNVIVNEETEIPEPYQYRNEASVLSEYGERQLQRSVLEKLEWIKCALDPIYYCRKYIKISLVDGGLSNLDLFKYQEEAINIFESNRFSILRWARQMGKTTVVGAYIMWYIHFQETKQAAILANKADQAQEIMERVQQSYELLPLFLKPGMRVYNKRSMTLSNKAKSFSAASSRSSIRGRSISLLYWDEAAHTPNDSEFYESIYPTISSGKETKMILTSTPKGRRGVFYRLWSDESSGFAKHTALWNDNPHRDEEWKLQTIGATSEDQFAQEYECEFLGSSLSLISSSTMANLVFEEPEEVFDNGLKVYYPVQEGSNYIIVCDTARGIGGDYSAFTVIDITNDSDYRVVCTFRNNTISTLLYPNIIYNTALQYNNAMVLVELNDLGEQVANTLFYELEYENLLCTYRSKQKNRYVLGYGSNMRPGVTTSTAVKSVGCSNLKTLIESGRLSVTDEVIIDELGNFVPVGNSYAADKDSTDDLVMTLVIFSWATAEEYFKSLTNHDLRQKLLQDRENQIYENTIPFGIIENDFGEFTGEENSDEFYSILH